MGINATWGVLWFVAFAVLIAIRYAFQNYSSFLLANNIILYFPWFFLGTLIRKFEVVLLKIRENNYLKFALIILASITSIFSALHPSSLDILTTLLLILTVYCCAPEKTCRFTEFIGDNSFGMYLFHSPLVYITYSYLSEYSPLLVVAINFIGFGILSIALTVLVRKLGLKFLIGE